MFHVTLLYYHLTLFFFFFTLFCNTYPTLPTLTISKAFSKDLKNKNKKRKERFLLLITSAKFEVKRAQSTLSLPVSPLDIKLRPYTGNLLRLKEQRSTQFLFWFFHTHTNHVQFSSHRQPTKAQSMAWSHFIGSICAKLSMESFAMSYLILPCILRLRNL